VNTYGSFFTAVWLTALATVPATARYPAIFISSAGNDTGAVTTTVPAAASVSPTFRSFLKKRGVDLFILFTIGFIAFLLNG
jgi:hypothetical protein